MIYTTNAIESLNAKLRRSVRSRGHFPREWAAAKAQFAAVFGDRFEVNRFNRLDTQNF
jgi:putative transposase